MQTDYAEDVRGVRVVRWNPERSPGVRVDNFGDLLGPLVVARLAAETTSGVAPAGRSLLTIGSILQFAGAGDVVWGSGINAKLRPRRLEVTRALDVRAVRGPLTAAMLEAEGTAVPATFGDPGLLLPSLFPETRRLADPDRREREVVVVPNVNDADLDTDGHPVVSPVGEPWAVIAEILRSGFVVGSSLHAVITAEAYGIPARAVRSPSESIVKYLDYYEGTGRPGVQLADSVAHAVELGGVPLATTFDPADLTAAFPVDLWDPTVTAPPAPSGPRPLDDVVADVTARAIAGDEGWQEIARRTAIPVLRERGAVLRPDQVDRVMTSVRELEQHEVLATVDGRLARTRVIADLRLGDVVGRAALLNEGGNRAVLETVHRATEDGVLRLGGTLQLPDGRLRDHRIRLDLADDDLSERAAVSELSLDEVDPLTGTVRWDAGVPVRTLREGASALVFTMEGPGGHHGDVVVRSAPPMRFDRWWHDDTPYRVDRTTRGNVVIHKETEHR